MAITASGNDDRMSNYRVIESTAAYLLIKDLGPWEQFLSVTNDAENVVRRLAWTLNGRRLFYIDSEGQTDELLVRDGRFAGYSRGGPQ